MKLFPFSALSFDFDSSDPCSLSPLGNSKRNMKRDISAEQKAGQEIQSILFKNSRLGQMTCAAPLPRRTQGEMSEDDLDVLEECLEPSPSYGKSQDRWFLNSPTQIPKQNADGTCLNGIQVGEQPSFGSSNSRPHRFARNTADLVDLPTTIVGTPPCRSGNPLVNDTHFLHMQRHDPTVSIPNSTFLGSELGLFRLSPSF